MPKLLNTTKNKERKFLDMFKKLNSTAKNAVQKGKTALCSLAPLAYPAIAALSAAPYIVSAGTTSDLVGGVLSVFCAVMKYAGIMLIAIGFVMFLLNLHDDNMDKKQKIIMVMIIGAVCFGFSELLQVICNKAGLGITIDKTVSI